MKAAHSGLFLVLPVGWAPAISTRWIMDMAKANVNRGRRFSAPVRPNSTGEEEGEPINRPNRDHT